MNQAQKTWEQKLSEFKEGSSIELNVFKPEEFEFYMRRKNKFYFKNCINDKVILCFKGNKFCIEHKLSTLNKALLNQK